MHSSYVRQYSTARSCAVSEDTRNFHSVEYNAFYSVQKTCTSKKVAQESMSDVDVYWVNRLGQVS